MTEPEDKPEAAKPAPPRAKSPVLDPKVLLEFLGASAGIAAFVALLGGALLWLRFDQLGLPADRAVTLLPRELLVTVGAHALIGSAIAGLMAVIAIWALDDRSDLVLGVAAFLGTAVAVLTALDSLEIWAFAVAGIAGLIAGIGVAWLSKSNGKGWLPKGIGAENRPMVVTLAIIGIGVVLILLRVQTLQVIPWSLMAIGVVAAGLVLVFVSMHRNRRPDRSRKPILWIVFAVYLAAGTAVALVRTGGEPKLEPIALLLKEPDQQLAGFYVGESEDEIHVAQLRQGSGLLGVSADPVEAIVSVARARVIRKAMRRPSGLGLGDDGREQVETLLESLVAEQRALTGEPVPPADPVATDTPVRTFAPLVSLHSDEPSGPMNAEDYLKSSRLFWAFRDCPQSSKAFGGDLTTEEQWRRLGKGGYSQAARCGRGDEYTTADATRPHNKRVFKDGRAELTGREGFYLDVADTQRRRELKTEHEGDQLVMKPVPVYFERHPERGNVRITYWFFYPFSFPTGTNEAIGHEGDWERISVLLREERKGLWRPLTVRFHEHSGRVDVAWDDARKAPDESGRPTHPRAYAARGSHATYRRGGKFLQVLQRGRVNILAVKDDARACPACPLWFTWQRLVDAEQRPWYGFGGAWGRVGSVADYTGPTGPSRDKTVGGKSPSPETSLSQSSDAPLNVEAAVAPVPAPAPPPK